MNTSAKLADLLNRSPSDDRGEPLLGPGIVIKGSMWCGLALVLASWSYVLFIHGIDWAGLFSASNMANASEFLNQLLGADVEEPAFLSAEQWWEAGRLTLDTLKMSILGIGLAGLGMLGTIMLGARTTADGRITLRSTRTGRFLFGVVRCLYVFARSIPELFWAMLIILVVRPGILAGALALAIHNFGILGKLCSEVVEDLDVRPLRSLRQNGANLTQILFYGIIPTVTPKFLTYLLYRWESIIRASIVVGFVSAGGLGRTFKLSMNWFHYSEVTLYLICYFILVVAVDVISGLLRALAKM
jgi:phosphonate transport system permease protein